MSPELLTTMSHPVKLLPAVAQGVWVENESAVSTLGFCFMDGIAAYSVLMGSFLLF